MLAPCKRPLRGAEFDMNLLALVTIASAVLAVALLIVLDLLRKARATLRARERSLEAFQQRLTGEMAKREAAEHALATTDTRDTETGTASRARFLASGEEELRRASRYGRAMSVLIVDPREGEELPELATFIHDALRDSDLLGRLGECQLAALLPETELATAREVAKRLSEDENNDAGAKRKKERSKARSVGCASLEPTDEAFDTMLARAEEALS